MTEAQIQIALVKKLTAAGIVHFHIPNGGKRRPREARTLKLMGTYPGVPDLFIVSRPFPGTKWPGLFLELKKTKEDGGKLSPDQIKWRDILVESGYEWRVAYGLDDAIRVLNDIGFENIS